MSDTKDKDENLKLYNGLFSAQSEYQIIWERNELYYRARYSDKKYKKIKAKRRSAYFIPTIRNTVNIIKAIFTTAFFSNGCPIELLGSDEEMIRDSNLVINNYYDIFNPKKELSKAMLSSLIFKMGIVATFWDKNSEKVITRFTPVQDLAFDNECTSIDDIEVVGFRKRESIRKIKEKIKNKVYDQPNLLKKLNLDDLFTKRLEIKILYKQTSKGWKEYTYIKDVLVREKKFKKLPFQFGYCLDEIPSVISDISEKQINCYGNDLVTILKPLQDELNQKRNLKNDIQEKILNPDLFVGNDAGVDPKDLTFGGGKRIQVKGKISEIKERQVPGEYSLTEDIGIIQSDLRDASSVNPIQEGQTGASDRRSARAMSVINANSSMRIEEMIMLITETLFDHWAKAWVKLVLENADDEVINKLTGKTNPFGVKGNRSFDYKIKINFGMSVDKESTISDLLQVIQMLAPDQQINPKLKEKILKKFLYLRLGDDTDLKELTQPIEQNVPPETPTPNNPLQKNEIIAGTL